MKSHIVILIFLLPFAGAAQIEIQEILPGTNQPPFFNELPHVTECAIASADIDADGDVDFLIQGSIATPASSINQSRIYLNNGAGDFTQDLDEVITGMKMGDADFGDVDGDGDLDFVANGYDPNGDATTELYLNDGTGHFTEATGMSFTGVYYSAIRFFDADGDLDLDFISSGNNNGSPVTQIYLNDGSGFFTLDVLNTLPPMLQADLEAGDIDLDGDIDLFLCGSATCAIYLNDGFGIFTLDPNLNITLSAAKLGEMMDFDFDGDLDFYAIVTNYPDQLVVRYLNDGTGLFIADSVSDFNPSNYILEDLKSFDYNLDGYMDLILSATNSGPITEIYLRHPLQDSLYLFASSVIPDFIAADMEVVDIDGDLIPELIMGGLDAIGTRTSIFSSSGSGAYQQAAESVFGYGYYESAMDFADIDNDGDLDMFVCGMKTDEQSSDIYFNDGAGNYSVAATTITDLWYGDCKFGDLDGDLDMDLFISGYGPSGPHTRLYLNDGTGSFSTSPESFIHLKYSTVSLADIDNDLDLDVMLTGTTGSSSTTRHYINNGSGSFTLAPYNAIIKKLSGGDAEFLDADMDGDQDFIISGSTNAGLVTEIYLNDGIGNFDPSPTIMTGLSTGSLVVADLDGDLDPDLVVSGENSVGIPYTYIYINNGSGTFSEMPNNLTQVDNSSVTATDFDGDSDIDILISGLEYGFLVYTTKLYTNDGLANFTHAPLPIEPVGYSSQKFADIDSDGDDDIVISGYGSCGPELRAYLNFSCFNSTTVTANICAGDYYVFEGDDTLFNILNDTVISSVVVVPGDCDTVHNTIILVSEIDTLITQTYNSLESAELAADNYTWFNCDSSGFTSISASSPLFEAMLPGNYALIINKDACTDTSICFTISNQDFYDHPSYQNLYGEVYPVWPTSSPTACDATVAAFSYGGIQPHHYEWFSQPSNTDSILLENACYGIYTLKISDALGDSIMVDYYVTDYTNYDSLIIGTSTISDTAYVATTNCLLDFSLPLDTVYVSNVLLLASDVSTETYEIEIVYSQLSLTYTVIDTITISNAGSAVLVLNIYCPTKSTGFIKTIITHFTPFFATINSLSSDLSVAIIYPNPFNDEVTILDAQINEESLILLFDINGKIVYSTKPTKCGSVRLDLSHLDAGSYLVQYTCNGQTKVAKIVRL